MAVFHAGWGLPSVALGLFQRLSLHLLLHVLPCQSSVPALQRDLRELRCPLETQSLSYAEIGQQFSVGQRHLWPAVLELVDRGLRAVFQEKDLPRARRVLADALDLAHGRWDYGVSSDALEDAVLLLPAMGFPAGARASEAASTAYLAPGLARAFRECPLGLAATYRALAMTHLADPRAKGSQEAWARAMAVSQRFHHLGYGFLIKMVNEDLSRSDPSYIDFATWPMTGEEWETERDYVANALKDQGGPTSFARSNVAKDSRVDGTAIALVTVCAYPEGSMLPHFASSVHQTYTQRHGYTYIHHRDEDEHLSAGRPKAWTKVRALHEALEDGRWEWVVWIDCDIYFMDLETTLDSLLLRYASRQVEETSTEASAAEEASALDPNVHLLITEDAQCLNTAIFMLRRSTWSLQLLRRVWGMDDGVAAAREVSASSWVEATTPFTDHPWWEQPAFTHQLLGNNHRLFQEMSYPEVDSRTAAGLMVPYPEQVRILPQKEMNSYHVISSKTNPDTTWTPGNFIMSFNGVKAGSGENVAQTVAANYYEVFCILNGLEDQCTANLLSFFQRERPELWTQRSSWRHDFEAVELAMFAPWLLQRPAPSSAS